MKKKFYLQGFIGLAVAGLLFVGCSKEQAAEPETYEMLSFDAEEVLDMLPQGLTESTDTYAQTCVAYVTTAVDMSGFISFMEVPSDAQRSAKKSSGDTWQWSWGYGGESFTMFWSFDEDDSKNKWSLDISYNGGPAYDYIDAWEYKDGSGGEVLYNFNWATMYDYGQEEAAESETEVLYWKYNWSKNGAGDYAINWFWESDSDDYEHVAGHTITIKADGSGTLDSFQEDTKLFQMIWDALGNGSWIMGDGQDSGSWEAG